MRRVACAQQTSIFEGLDRKVDVFSLAVVYSGWRISEFIKLDVFNVTLAFILCPYSKLS